MVYFRYKRVSKKYWISRLKRLRNNEKLQIRPLIGQIKESRVVSSMQTGNHSGDILARECGLSYFYVLVDDLKQLLNFLYFSKKWITAFSNQQPVYTTMFFPIFSGKAECFYVSCAATILKRRSFSLRLLKTLSFYYS